jgi:hypothetical protein
MKFENNWRQKTIENLEKDVWTGHADGDTGLVKKTMELRKIPLDSFTTEDLRIMIGQQFSLPFLVPLALEVLSKDLFAEGDFYEGDLLQNVLAVKTDFWNNNKAHWHTLNNVILNRHEEIVEKRINTTNFYKSQHAQ